MQTISDAMKQFFKEENPQKARLTITPVSGSAFLITETDIVQGTLYVNHACTGTESLELGSVMSSECGFSLFHDSRFDNVDFEGAEVFVEVGNGTTYIPMGYFTIDDAPKVRDTISIVALDRMMFTDAEVTDSTIKGANRTIRQYVERICTVCGLTLATNITSYPNVGYVVPKFPDEVGITYRQLLSWCCQIMGKCAYVDWQGNMRIEFPTSNGAPVETISETERFESDYEDYTVTTTGVYHLDGEGNETIVGTKDYAFDISGNALLQDVTIMSNINVSGITYRPFSATTIPYPWLMPLDYVNYRKDGTNYKGLLTHVTFRLNGHTELTSVGESQKARSYARKGEVSTATRLVLERKVAELNTEIDTAMDTAVYNATQLIKSSLGGGYIVMLDKNNDGHYDELLIMDTPSTATATKVWRWNQNGLGYSSNGYNGNYALAITSTGQIVADFITTGTMNVSHIGGNIANGNWGVDFDNGTMALGSLAVSNITGNIANGDWKLDFDNGTFSIGDINVSHIGGNIANGNWGVDFDHGTFTIGDISANNIRGGTLVVGGSNNTNGVITVKDANGNVVGTLDRNGISTSSATITGGTINISASSSDTNVITIKSGSDTVQVRPYVYYITNGTLYTEMRYGGVTVRKTSSPTNPLAYLTGGGTDGYLMVQNATATCGLNYASGNNTLSLNGTSSNYPEIFLNDGTNNITIKATSNVATLSYTVVSTF